MKNNLSRTFHTQLEMRTPRRVGTRGLQQTKGRPCRPGSLTRRSGHEIYGLGPAACGLSLLLSLALAPTTGIAQEVPRPAATAARPALPPPPAPLDVPRPGPTNDAPYAPQPIVPGGVVVPLYPPGSPFLNLKRVTEAEQYNLNETVPGRLSNLVNVHNPSIEMHTVDPGRNTGAAIILAAGGAHTALYLGSDGGDMVPFFRNYGVNAVILRNRLKRDGYNPLTDEVYDALQAIRLVRAHARDWSLDPRKIGIMGFSAGAELAAATAVAFDAFDRKNHEPSDPLAGITSRPDFVALLYPGPTPFARDPQTFIPSNAPPAFIAGAGAGDKVHAVWADQYFAAMLRVGIPNVEMHIYGNGIHAGGLNDRLDTPFGTWQFRFIDWFRDLGFLQPPGIETKAAADIAAYQNPPARSSAIRTSSPGTPPPVR
jgi:acetyl esterase/lipase